MLKRIILIIIAILLSLPSAGNTGKAGKNYHFTSKRTKSVILGLENFVSKYARKYRGKEAAVVTNHTGTDYNLRRNLNLIRNRGIRISLILAPEHGLASASCA